jgi:predicted secreted Zn-dependent protease
MAGAATAPVAADESCAGGVATSAAATIIEGRDAGVRPPPGAEWRLVVTEQHCVFTIEARDEKALNRFLAEREATGTPRWHGMTRAVFDVRFETGPLADGCRFTMLDMRTDIELWLPHWQPPATLRQRRDARWQDQLDALAKHERAHRAQKVDTAVALYRELAALDASDCVALKHLGRQRIERALQRLRLKSAGLDALTDHGRRTLPAR